MIKILIGALGVIFGLLLGLYIYPRKILKPEGVITFFLQKIDDDVEVIQCSVKPDTDWGNLINHKRIIFSIARTQELEEAITKGLIKKEN